MTIINSHTTRGAGTILTAAIYNVDHVNHIANAQALNSTKLEGATPPVVDGQGVLWLGTTGAALRTAGYVPANAATLMSAGAGLLGGGDMSANRSFAVNPETQAGAEAGANNIKAMTALRTRQWFDHLNAKASQADAEAATESTKWTSPLRVRQLLDHANAKASQAEAEAGANDTKWMSPLRTKQAISSLGQIRAWGKGTNLNLEASFGCVITGVQPKTVTLAVAAPHDDYPIVGVDGAQALEVSSVTTAGFNYTMSSGGRWSFIVIW